MEHLPLPEKYEVKKSGEHQAQISIEPLYPGYGTTVGNALRRVLLSSLAGAAVTAFKIKGSTHEFSTIPGVKEDLVEIILNVKTVRFRLHDVEETRATLKVRGEKKVKAKDIKVTSEIEIINPDAEIATLTEKNAELDMEFVIKAGRGYLPVENVEKKRLELGTIAIDAIFSPVRNVNFDVENVRVGQMTNYDRLIMSVSTDGTITPEAAVRTAATMLVEHFDQVVTLSSTPETKIKAPEAKETSQAATAKEEKKEPEKEETEGEEKPKKKRGRPKKES